MGRPRLTPEDLQERLAAYCERYRVAPGPEGLPPFPSGRRETPQHREWLHVYKIHQRLARRARGSCERCDAPAEDGSIFCAAHREPAARQEPRDARAQADGGPCPICLRPADAAAVRHVAGTARQRRSLLHEPCRELVSLSRHAGPDQLQRVLKYLWPRRRSQGVG